MGSLVLAWDVFMIFLGIRKPQDTSFGSAQWANSATVRRMFTRKNKGLLIDGQKKRLSAAYSFRHLLLIAPTGQGKTTRYILSNLLSTEKESEQAYVITDVKGEIFNLTHQHLMDAGFECKIINLGGDTSLCYNPLLRANTDEEIAKVAKVLINIGTEGNKEAFWNNQAKQLLTVLIHVLKNYLPQNKPMPKSPLKTTEEGEQEEEEESILNLQGWLAMIQDEQERADLMTENAHYCTLKNVNRLAKILQYKKADIEQFVVDYTPNKDVEEDFLSIAHASEKTFSNVISTVLSALQPINFERASKLSAFDDIEFEALRDPNRKIALFIQNKTTDAENYKFLLTMLYTQIFDFCQATGDAAGTEQGHAKQQLRPIHFMLDEFGNVGKIPNFASFVSLIRSAKCSLSIVIQELAQINKTYGREDAQTIVSNLNSKIMMGGVQNLETLSLFSKLMGEETIVKTSTTGTSNEDKMARPLMTSDELRRLNEGESVLLVANKPPIKLQMKAFFELNKLKRRSEKGQFHTLNEHNFGQKIDQITPFEIRIEAPRKKKTNETQSN